MAELRSSAEVGASPLDRIVSSIGPKLQKLRMQQGLSLQQLAERADVSAAAIHKIERSGMVPTIATLVKLAVALRQSVGYFVDEDSGPAVLIPATLRRPVYTPHRGIELQGVSGPYGHFFMAGAVATLEPGASSGENLLQHPGEELVHCLEGVVEFDIDRRSYHLSNGDTIHFRSDRPHQWWNPGPETAKALWMTLRPL